MKRISTFILGVMLLLLSLKAIAQVGIGTTTPNNAAILDVTSVNKGFLPPRVANVSAITTPVAGLMVYVEDKQCMKYYNGTIWSDCMGGITPVFTCGDTMTDIDGNTYPTILIGTQCWMASDLKVSKYPNGNPIPYIDNNATWGALADNNTLDAYSFYEDNNNDGSVDIIHPDYGALYTYSAAIADDWVEDNNADQGVCPDGWHLPTDAEWTTLIDFLGGMGVAGGKMKESGITHWSIPNAGATNSSYFTALPTGNRNSGNGVSFAVGNSGYWWSSTEFSTSNNAYVRYLDYFNDNAIRFNYNKSFGYSVRCVRN